MPTINKVMINPNLSCASCPAVGKYITKQKSSLGENGFGEVVTGNGCENKEFLLFSLASNWEGIKCPNMEIVL